jgi:hypothetical protein
MFTLTNFLRFIMAAAMATACSVVLLSSPSLCPCSGVRLDHLELASGNNGTQAAPSIKVRSPMESTYWDNLYIV